ncbi:MAG TPA: gamma-glutamyltransferase [Gemmatimonadaceae bacterium]|nr:gamma-glutamyltransferase [Gemmatimonadaceae bacterium]
MRMRLAIPFATLLFSACSTNPPSPVVRIPSTWPHQQRVAEVRAEHAMVASDAPLASRAGVEVLRAGGNAVDAAVATGFALAVVYPEAGNLGGGGFTVVRMADGRVAAIDYREMAPLAATRDMYANDTTDASVVGPLASGVPGSVAGMVETHARFGRLPLAVVLAPAIRLADEGFVVDSLLGRSLRQYASLIGRFEGGKVFLPGGEPLARGALLKQPALARTLRAIAAEGAAAFYTGSISGDVASDLRAAGSIITAEDLARYEVEWREPLRATYRGHTLITMPPPSSGVTMVQALNILEGFAPLPPYGSARHSHLVASAMQRAFVDRNAQLADPAFASVPTERLADKSYAARLRASIRDRATATQALASPVEGQHTTHYSVADAEGNVVSTTTTINDLYGSGVYLPTVGIFMNDEMDDFAANPGKPNLFGLVQGEQNAIQPGKRMLSSMLPTVVLDRAGRPLLIVGARGGPRIVTSVLQTIVNVVDHRMSLADAINAPRIHHQALPDTIRYERNGFTRAFLDSLGALGYGTAEIGNIGSVNGIMRSGDHWVGYSDPRSGGRPAGY